jgi:hypothetical protein
MLAREYAGAFRVDAVDVNPPRFPVYDHAYLGDIRRLPEILPAEPRHYDLALLIDVIEHLDRRDALQLLDRLTERAGKVLITTPWGFRHQTVPGEPHETHRSGWYPWSFGAYRVHRWSVFPGHFTRHLRLPRLWQVLVLVSRR